MVRKPDGESQLTDDMALKPPDATVCVRRVATGDGICIPFTTKRSAGDEPVARLQVTTGDLRRGELDLRVVEAGVLLVQGRSAPNYNGLRSGVLCQGLRLHVGERETARVRISVALDEL